MAGSYEVGFKDVYPWVWSVLFGVSLTLAVQRGAFGSFGVSGSRRSFWAKNLSALAVHMLIPVVLFSLAMVRVGPRYPSSLGFWDIIGCLYFAGVPLGAHQAWLVLAARTGWLEERPDWKYSAVGGIRVSSLWLALALGIPVFATVFACPLPRLFP